MGSKVVITYKRKRLFSRSDLSLINLHSDTSCKSAKSKTSDNFNDTGFGSHAYSKDDVREDVLQCESHDSHCYSQCSEKHARKPDMLYSACAEQKDSSVSVEAQKYAPDMKCFPIADGKQIICNLNECPEVRYNINSSGPSNAVKSGSEYEANCKKILTVSQPPDACSSPEPGPICLKTSAGINLSCQIKGTCNPEAFTLEETDKVNTDQYSSLCNISGMKRKLTSGLITFCRRSKRNTADIVAKSATLPAASCLVDLKSEKEIPVDNDNSCSFLALAPAPAPATSRFVLADNPQHFPHGEAVDSPNAATDCSQDSQEQMLHQKICMDVQDNHHINVTTQRLSNKDVKSRLMHSDLSGKGGSVLSLDLYIPPHVSHNIDCNLPPDSVSDENQPVEKSELLHDSPGSTSKMKEETLSLPVQHVENGSPVRAGSDKGKCILESPPVSTCNSSKNKYIQFFPESRNDGVLQLGNNSEKVSPANLISLSLQLEQMVGGCASFPPSHEWPLQQPREYFRSLQLSNSDQTQSFTRDKMMLDNILTRARAVRGNRSNFLDKFEYPTTWLDEELDSLWIGVRRHGRGNWDAIIGDRRLHFLPWKTPWDLAERWQAEQSRLLCTMPVSQRRYTSPPDFSSVYGNILHHPRPEAQADEVSLSLGLPPYFMNKKTKKDVQKPVTEGSLPHWLRTSAEISLGPSRLAHIDPSGCHAGPAWLKQPSFNCGATPQQPWLSNRYICARRRPEPQNGGKDPLVIERSKTQPDEHPAGKQEDLIIIPSDASSEETISDDHSIRPYLEEVHLCLSS